MTSYLKVTTIWVSRIYLIAFLAFSILALPDNRHLVGSVFQQIFIAFMIFFRLRRKKPLFMIPDEMLACLPYFWALSTLGSASYWFVAWQFFFLAAFALSMLSLVGNCRWFVGGLRLNSLLQAIYCAVMFVLIFATFLRTVFPPFTGDLYRETLLNSLVFFAGIPVCLVAAESGRSSQA